MLVAICEHTETGKELACGLQLLVGIAKTGEIGTLSQRQHVSKLSAAELDVIAFADAAETFPDRRLAKPNGGCDFSHGRAWSIPPNPNDLQVDGIKVAQRILVRLVRHTALPHGRVTCGHAMTTELNGVLSFTFGARHPKVIMHL